MNELRPWSGFEALVNSLVDLEARARTLASRSVDETLTVRNWLVGAWIVGFEQEGHDRARYGEGLLLELAKTFKRLGIKGFSARNLRNYRPLALTWPTLAAQREATGELGLPADIRQTLSAKFVPAVMPRLALLPWQDAWVLYATGGLDQQVFVSRYLTRLPSETQLRAWLAEERASLARRRAGD